MNIRGGRTFYGQDIGILMMDTKFPRIPGDPGNAATFDFPVCYKVVRDVFQGDRIPRDADEIRKFDTPKSPRALRALFFLSKLKYFNMVIR